MSYVYFIKPKGQLGPIKIGMSNDPVRRLQQIAAWSPWELELIAQFPGNVILEGRFHHAFIDAWMHHEWFAWSDTLQTTIDEINAGIFDPNTLPNYAGVVTAIGSRELDEIDAEYASLRRKYFALKKGKHFGFRPHELHAFIKISSVEKKAAIRDLLCAHIAALSTSEAA